MVGEYGPWIFFEGVSSGKTLRSQGPYSPTISNDILNPVLQIFLHLEAFEFNTTSVWLNHTVYPIRSCVTLKLADIRQKDKDCSGEWLMNVDPHPKPI